MSVRPLVLVAGLSFGDYLLWHWSLNSNHDVIALVSGLTLPPLAVALVWLLTLNVMRLLVGRGRMPARSSQRHRRGRAGRRARVAASAAAARREPQPAGARGSASKRSSGKIAA